jgi:GT2 family glycosyltransferase
MDEIDWNRRLASVGLIKITYSHRRYISCGGGEAEKFTVEKVIFLVFGRPL